MKALLRDFQSFKHYRRKFPHDIPEMVCAAYRDVMHALTVELF